VLATQAELFCGEHLQLVGASPVKTASELEDPIDLTQDLSHKTFMLPSCFAERGFLRPTML
jgi:hypothetical protein